jgi:ATP-binding cassette subfamily B protein
VEGVRAVIACCLREAPLGFSLVLVLTLIGGCAGPAGTWALQAIVDALGQQSSGMNETIARAVVILMLVTVALAVVPLATRFFVSQLGRSVTLASNSRLYDTVNEIDQIERFEDPTFQDQLHMAQEASQLAPIQTVSALTDTMRSVVAAVSYVALLVHVRAPLLLLVAVASAPMLWSVVRDGRRQIVVLSRTAPLIRKMTFFSSLMSEPQAVKEIRVFGLGRYFRDRLTSELGSLQRVQRRAEARALVDEMLATTLSAACAAGAIWYVAHEASQGRMSSGDVVAVAAAVAGTIAAFSGLAQGVVGTWEAGVVYTHLLRLEALTGAAPSLAVERALAGKGVGAGLAVRGAWFNYPGLEGAVRDVSVDVKPGTSLAIVGANGAGKSTLLKMLARIYRPSRGQVFWNGRDIWSDGQSRRYLDNVAVVFQDFMTYDLSVAENISVGNIEDQSGESRDAVVRAAQQAGADGFIGRLPHGYDTLLSRTFATEGDDDGAAFLSGGQWQRLATARALVKAAPVLILDEPTSGGDVSVERRFRELIRTREGSGVTICVSHRLALVKDFTQIVVLDAGRIVERGTHAELLAAQRGYAAMYEEQAEGYALSAGTSP